MIAGLRGILENREGDTLVVDVQGVSYRVHAPASTLSRVGAVGEAVKLYTHLYVREGALALYGFATADELTLFEQLLTVSGVGPKAALSLLSAFAPETLRTALAQGNVDLLTRVPGIGKKTAGRLVLELRGKIDLGALGAPALSGPDAEVVAALTNLGWPASEAQRVVAALPKDSELSVAEKIRLALQAFASR